MLLLRTDHLAQRMYASAGDEYAAPATAAEGEVSAGPSQLSSTAKGKKRKAGSASTSQGTRQSKRLRSQPESRQDVASQPPPQSETPDPPSVTGKRLTANERQAVKYVHELGSHGIRSYATGFLIENYQMTLWYMDRMGVVQSDPFDFIDEPHFLLLYVAAVKYATPTQLGFFPLLKFPTHPINAKVLQTFKDVALDISGGRDAEAKTYHDLRFSLDVTDERPIITTHGAVGRATIVVPVKAATDSEAAVSLGKEAKLISKISWQPHWRVGEDTHIYEARAAVKRTTSTRDLLKHIVALKCSLTRTMAEIGLPRAVMAGLPTMHPDSVRVCRVLVMDEYLPLRMVDSVAEFKAVFLGVLKGQSSFFTCNLVPILMFAIRSPCGVRDSEDSAS